MKYQNKLAVAFMLMGMCAVNAHSQSTILTLEQCRQMAIERNVKLQNAETSIYAAQETQKEAFTNYFPTVSASGMAYNANKGLIQMEMEPGTTMNLLKDGIMGGVTITQPLFAGGQIVNGNKLAKVGVEATQLQKEMTEKEVLQTVEQYYWNVVTLHEKKRTLQTVDEMLKNICGDVETAVSAGIKTRNDLLQVQLKLNDVKSSMINLDNGLSLSRMVLAQFIGMTGTDLDVMVCETMIDSVPEFPLYLKVNHDEALLNTPEYRLLQSDVKAKELQRKLEVGKNMPTIGVGAGYMYDNLTDKDHPFGIAFVSVSVPISGWWGGSHAINQKKAQVTMASATLSDTSDLLVINMQHLWDDVKDAYEQILLAHNSIEQSTENLRLNRNYYNAGMTTMSDLLDAQSMYQQSRDKLVDAYSDFKIKELEYRLATNQQ
jgi:outer membrane protein TolC